MKNTIVGIDLAKNSFTVHVADHQGRMLKQRKNMTRTALQRFVSSLPKCVIAIEACGGSHHWGRKFLGLGHDVRMVAPQFVKPYVKADKTDARDAAAIAEAASRAHMNFVPVKTLNQQDLKLLHSVRDRLVRSKVQLTNETRGLLSEYGITVAKGDRALKEKLMSLAQGMIPEGWIETTDTLVNEMQGLLQDLTTIENKIAAKDKQLGTRCKEDDAIQRLMEVPGIGPITASALVAHVGNAKTFKSSRQFAAYLGLVPREHSTGGKIRHLGITKRGDKNLRTLLIHGARAMIAGARYVKKDRFDEWMRGRSRQLRWAHALLEKKDMNRATVALANKHARIAWAILTQELRFDPEHKSVRVKKAG